jgi:hypothetical protein
VKGAHSAAIQEDNWDAIADFILSGGPARASRQLLGPHRSRLVEIPGAVAPIIWVVIAAVLGAIGYAIVRTHTQGGWPQWQTTLLFVGYLITLWTVLTRV